MEEIIKQCDRVQDVIEKLLNIHKYETVPYVDEEMLNLFEPELLQEKKRDSVTPVWLDRWLD